MRFGNGTSVTSNKKELGLKSQFRRMVGIKSHFRKKKKKGWAKAQPFKEKLFSKSLRAGIKIPVPKNGGTKVPVPKRGENKWEPCKLPI